MRLPSLVAVIVPLADTVRIRTETGRKFRIPVDSFLIEVVAPLSTMDLVFDVLLVADVVVTTA